MKSRADIRVRINMNSSIIATGTWNDIRTEADRVLNLSRERPNTCLGVGVLPYETIPHQVLKLEEYVRPF